MGERGGGGEMATVSEGRTIGGRSGREDKCCIVSGRRRGRVREGYGMGEGSKMGTWKMSQLNLCLFFLLTRLI